MPQKTFIPLLEEPTQLIVSATINPITQKVIKKSDSGKVKSLTRYRLHDLDENNVKISAIEDGDVVKAIRFVCQCGCKATVSLTEE